MKILLLKTREGRPLQLRQAHKEKIEAVDPTIEVVEAFAHEEGEVARHLSEAQVIAGVPFALPSSVAGAQNLKWIHSFSAGVEKVLTPEVKNSQVLVTNSSGIHAVPIAEHIIGFMLLFTRKFSRTFEQQRQKLWEKSEDLTELRKKTVLIAGLGHIGRETARLAKCMGMQVSAIDVPGKEKPDFVKHVYTTDQFDQALPEADFVALCLPYTKETYHLFGKEKFSLMKKSAVIINIGRGGVIAEEELIEALEDHIIGGAALDVTEEEPLPKESPLWGMENVVITPHHSGWSEKYMDRAIEVFCINLKAYLKGERLPNLVDKEKGY